MAISLTKNGNAIVFAFDDNDHYLNDGTIEVPVNSLTLVTDESNMFTFKKAASDDIFISGLYSEIGMSKAELIAWYKDNMVGSTGGGGVTSGEVQTMIDESISGKADTSDVQNVASDVASVSGDVNTLSGSVNSNHNAITALNGDVSSLSGQVETDEKVTATALVDLDNRKLDASAYTPTDLSNYYTKSQTNTQINNATNTLLDAGEFYEYTASNDERVGDIEDRLSEDEEVTSAALNELNEALSGKQDTLIAGTNITISGNVISAEGGGGGVPESAFTAYTAATEARLAEDEEVTAAALNVLNTALGGLKLVSISQADYDLLPVKDPNTLYFITNVVN